MTNFETKDSGERIEYVSGMRRDVQTGKPRFDLLLVDNQPYDRQFLTRFARLLERGAKKYGERNWQLADSPEEIARFKASALRHMMQWQTGETDEDHAAAVAFNLMAAEYVKWKLEEGIGKTITAADMNDGVRDSIVEEEEDGLCFNSSCRDKGQCDFGLRIPQDGNSSSGGNV